MKVGKSIIVLIYIVLFALNYSYVHANNYNAIYCSYFEENDTQYDKFLILTKDYLNENVILQWYINKDDKYDDIRNKSIKFMTDFSKLIKNNNFNDLIYNNIDSQVKIKNFTSNVTNVNDGEKVYTFEVQHTMSSSSRFWLTTGEVLFLNILGQANYWINKHENMDDWEYKFNFTDFKRKVADGWSFDPNNFRINTIGHAYSGAQYYMTARTNGYGILGSTMAAFGGSLFWEYIGEYREQVSFNDMIITPFGGALLGEGLFLIADYIQKSFRPGFFRDLVVFVICPWIAINKYINSVNYSSYRVQVYIQPPVDLIAKKVMYP